MEHNGERELEAGEKKNVKFHDDTSGVLEAAPSIAAGPVRCKEDGVKKTSRLW
jgi:hypothetical protein